MHVRLFSMCFALFVCLSQIGWSKPQQDDLQKRVEILEDELADLKKQVQQNNSHSFGPDMGKLHFHGYAELHFNSPAEDSFVTRGNREWDFHRFVVGMEYEFTENIRVDTEVDFEHLDADDLELEYGYVEMDLHDNASLRVGSLLMPVGPLNEFHEPPQFYSVERPYLQKSIIPTTWQELGAGFAGQVLDNTTSYRLYFVSGLDASGFTTKDGIRGGRSHGRQPSGEDFGVVGRLEHGTCLPGLKLGTSFYYAGADQDIAGLDRVRVALYEGDARWSGGGFDLLFVYARVDIAGADNISSVVGETIGSTMNGYYAEAAYHLAEHLLPAQCDQDVVIFTRREQFDTNEDVPSGFAKNLKADREIWTFGAAYYPIPQLAFKADYERWHDAARDRLGRFNLGVGWQF